jgi:hypothetical protein
LQLPHPRHPSSPGVGCEAQIAPLHLSTRSGKEGFRPGRTLQERPTSRVTTSARVSRFMVRFCFRSNPGAAADLVISAPDKLVNAWKGTPTKWYPIPIAVGALHPVAIRYRKKSKRGSGRQGWEGSHQTQRSLAGVCLAFSSL